MDESPGFRGGDPVPGETPLKKEQDIRRDASGNAGGPKQSEASILSYKFQDAAGVISLIFGVPLSTLVMVAALEQQDLFNIVLAFLSASFFWLGFTWLPFVARVDLYADRLELTNPWGTFTIPVGQIEKLWGRRFLIVQTADGRTRLAWAVQVTNLAATLGQETLAGRVARELTEAIANLPGSNDVGVGVSWQFPKPPWFYFAGEIAFLLIGIVAFIRL